LVAIRQKTRWYQRCYIPIVADTTKVISLNFDTLFGDYDVNDNGDIIATGPMIAFRGLFLIDKGGIVRHQLINDLPLGRNVDEALRMVDALQYFETKGEVCPANWSKGKDGLKDTHAGVADYLAKH
jgi:peroxiredoxin (alkyl hydroperoxide reductase subunit C)